MGICETISNINKEKKNIKKYRINEVKIGGSNLNEIDKNIFDMSPSACKIKILKRVRFFNKNKKIEWRKFIFFNDKWAHYSKGSSKIKKNIQILYDYESKKIRIDLDKDKRFIKDFTDIKIDIIIIQILKEDIIDEKYFLL